MQFGPWRIEPSRKRADGVELSLVLPSAVLAEDFDALTREDLCTLKHALALWLELEAARAENRYIPSKT